MTMYGRAPEVEAIAAELIAKVPDHKLLREARLECVFRDKASRSNGRIVLGKARRVSGLNAFLADDMRGESVATPDPFFVVEIARDTWQRLDDAQRRALVDHELCHFHVEVDSDGNPELSMRRHDLEEFAGVVERHGLWASHVATFGSAVAEQLALAVEEVVEFVDGLEDDDGA